MARRVLGFWGVLDVSMPVFFERELCGIWRDLLFGSLTIRLVWVAGVEDA